MTPEYKITPKQNWFLKLKELGSYRELFYFFAWRDVKVRYKQTILGFLWAILQPIAMMLIFTIFFSGLLSVPTDGLPGPVFYFSGLLLWNFFSSGLSGATNSMINNSSIIKKVYFPRIVIPGSAIFANFFDFLMGIIAFLGLIAYYAVSGNGTEFLSWKIIPFYTLATLLCGMTTLGTGLFISALSVKYRDFRYIVPFMIQFLLFASPVIYPVSVLGGSVWEKLLALNPLTGVMALARAGFTGVALDPAIITISGISALLLLLLGIFTFSSTESYFADIA